MFITGKHGLVIKNLGLLAHVLAIGKADNDKLRQTKKDLNVSVITCRHIV